MSVVDESDDLMRSVTSALNYCLDYVTGTRLPVPEWVRETRDQAVAALHERDAEAALEDLANTRPKPTARPGPGGPGSIRERARPNDDPETVSVSPPERTTQE